MTGALRKPWIASTLFLILFLGLWHVLTTDGPVHQSTADEEDAKLAGASAQNQHVGAIPGPIQVVKRGYELLLNAFDRSNPNNVGIAWHLLYSLGRVMLGFGLAAVVAVPLGFAIGLLPALY